MLEEAKDSPDRGVRAMIWAVRLLPENEDNEDSEASVATLRLLGLWTNVPIRDLDPRPGRPAVGVTEFSRECGLIVLSIPAHRPL